MNYVLKGNEARQKLLAGIDTVHSTVAPTLGANGRNTVYNKWSRVPIITNDGVSIAREVEPEDLGELQGANLLKQVSERTNDEAGDGTTTSIVIAHSMITNGIKLLSDPSKKVNPMKLRREMIAATEKVIDALKASAQKVTTLEELEQVATISVESEEIGKIIAKAIYDAGDNGIVYVNDSEQIGVSIEKGEGYEFAQGLITPYLIANPDKMETVLENPAIIITELMVNASQDFYDLVSWITKSTKDILLICDEIHPDMIKFAVLNMAKGNFRMMIVKKPMQSEFLEDIASLTSTFALSQNKGKIKYVPQYLGGARKVVVTMKDTKIFDGNGKNGTRMVEDFTIPDINSHIENLKVQLESADEVLKTKLQERIAKLTGGVYMLNVGEKTEAEAKYLRLKVDDAVNATKAAKEEGIVAGGGMALFKISSILMDDNTDGASIIYQACLQPLATIVSNSGADFTEIANEVNNSDKGFDALTLEIVPNMIAAGIIDPVKVTRSAFQNASSFAGLLLTTESLIVPIPEPKEVGLPR